MSLNAERLKHLRQDRGFTQEELAERAGLHLRAIQRYETEGVDPGLDAAQRLAKALNTTLGYLAGETSDSRPGLVYEELSDVERDLILAVRQRQMDIAVQKLAVISQNPK